LTRNRGARLVAAAASIVLVDAAWLALAHFRGAPPEDDFARATCGIGLGVAVTPDWSFHDVDPRQARTCESELFPLPGLACSDPNHGTGVALLPDRK
jgi:hypothetical protein